METLAWSFDLDNDCKDLFENGVFSFLFQKNSSACLSDLEHNLEKVVLESGETYELRILFKPGKNFYLNRINFASLRSFVDT